MTHLMPEHPKCDRNGFATVLSRERATAVEAIFLQRARSLRDTDAVNAGFDNWPPHHDPERLRPKHTKQGRRPIETGKLLVCREG